MKNKPVAFFPAGEKLRAGSMVIEENFSVFMPEKGLNAGVFREALKGCSLLINQRRVGAMPF
jgi:hypothetical protein